MVSANRYFKGAGSTQTWIFSPNTVFHLSHYGQESLRHVCFLQFSLISVQPLPAHYWNVQIALVTDFPRVIIMTSAFSGDQRRWIDYVDTSPVRKLAEWGVTSVTSNQRKWLIEQCFDMFSVLPLFRMSDFSVPEWLALFSFKFVVWFCSNSAWFCLHFPTTANQNKLTSFSHVLYPCH